MNIQESKMNSSLQGAAVGKDRCWRMNLKYISLYELLISK